ncbi:MAG: carboxyl-terminal protease [Acidobacteriales bacterium]|nr:MAG: carboxyl-terminal protease [Terriglobales bacterium]
MNPRFRFLVVSTSVCLLVLLLVGAHLGRSASTSDGAYRHMAVFTEVLSRIKSDYVEEPDLKNVTLGAVNGLLEAVDPFASYLNADQYKQYLKEKDAASGDVGLVLAKRYGYVAVVSALPGSPAANAGVGTGDLIENIKGIATRDMPLAYAQILLKGQPGSAVEISLLHVPDPEPQKVALTRAVVLVPPVTARMLPDQIGYIRPETMLTGKAAEIASAVRSLESQGAKGLVLDLRQCALGTSEEGLAVANLFLDKGLMTYLLGQRLPRQNFQADPAKAITRLPLVVTTNRGTADGAEIAAMALLENKRAEVVGERTFGDAAVRRAINLEDGGALILSVGKYYSQTGKAIQDTGVVPSVPYVESEPVFDAEDETPQQPLAPRPVTKPEDDNLLKKAIEVLAKGPGVAASPAKPGMIPRERNSREPLPLAVPK